MGRSRTGRPPSYPLVSVQNIVYPLVFLVSLLIYVWNLHTSILYPNVEHVWVAELFNSMDNQKFFN